MNRVTYRKFIFEIAVALIVIIGAIFCIYKYKNDKIYIFPNEIIEVQEGGYKESEDVISVSGDNIVVGRTPTFSLRSGSYAITVNYNSTSDARLDVSGSNSCNFSVELPASGNQDTEVTDTRLSLITPTEKAYMSISLTGAGDMTLNYIKIESPVALYRDYLLLAMSILAMGLLLIIIIHKFDCIFKNKKSVLLWAVMTGIFAVSMLLVFGTEIRRAVDIRCHLLRINGIFTGLLDRQFPVVVYPNFNNEFGQISVLYPNVLLYIPAILRYVGISMRTAYIYYALIINALTMIFAYICFKTISEDDSMAAALAIMYYLAPNRMRFNLLWGSVAGAGTALAFLPLAIAGLYCILRKHKAPYYLMLPIGVWGMFTSHLLSTIFAIVILGIIALVRIKDLLNLRAIRELFISVVIFVLLSLSTLLPFFDYYFEGFNHEALEWGNVWSYEYEVGRTFTEFACGYRIVDMCLAAIGLICVLGLLINKIRIVDKGLTISFLLMALLGIFTITKVMPWRILFENETLAAFLSGTFQYPDRILTIVEPALVMVYMYIFMSIKPLTKAQGKFKSLRSIIGLLSFSLILVGCFVDYYTYYTVGEKMLFDSVSGEIEWSFDDYLPAGTLPEWYASDTGSFSNYDSINIESHSKIYTHITTRYTCSTEGEYLEYPLFYYKGYEAYDQNGNPLRIEKGDRNYVRVYLDKCDEAHEVNLLFKVKSIYRVSIIVSFVSFILIFLYYIVRVSKGRK